MNNQTSNHISIIGGAGHVGLPLGLAFASKNFKIHLIDKNKKALKNIEENKMPFLEIGAKKLLQKANKKKLFFYENDLSNISKSKYIIICIGTPIDKKLKPDLVGFYGLIKKLKNRINKNQILVVRSSVLPGTNQKIKKILKNKNSNLVYGPERIVQSKSLIELPKLPQILACEKKSAFESSKKLFLKISKKIIKTSILEAELIKLYSNANRYINFAIANQLYTICHLNNLDFKRVRNIMQDGYARNLNLTNAGFTAGPCLVKDTMQLKYFTKNSFSLGSAAMKVNENIPNLIIDKLKKFNSYKSKKIGLLGLTFKGETDDTRDSLSIVLLNKLKKLNLKILQSDEYYKTKNGISKKELINKSDIIIIGAPHKAYKKLKINKKKKKLIDIWDII
tara:strand:- start:942 stop:2123 length:1182 start_codon:yes stop_codon:yes gene_type:complete